MVFSVFDENVNDEIVLKVINAKTGTNSLTYLEKMVLEMVEPFCLDRHLLCFEGFFRDSEYIYLMTNYIKDSIPLFYLENNNVDIFNCTKMCYQLIEAVETLHSLGIVHLDIKLDNVLYDKDFNVTLIDYGLCCFSSKNQIEFDPKDSVYIDNLILNKQVYCRDVKYKKGTLSTMAPELFRNGLIQIDKYSDIYSLGCVMFYIYSLIFLINNEYRSYQYDLEELNSSSIEEVSAKILSGVHDYHMIIKKGNNNEEALQMIKSTILRMLSLNHEQRPKITELKLIFNRILLLLK